MALQQGLLVEKCRFLESSGCVQTCLHACKVPTQRFFLEEMGLPVTLRPNMTDLRYIYQISSTHSFVITPSSIIALILFSSHHLFRLFPSSVQLSF